MAIITAEALRQQPNEARNATLGLIPTGKAGVAATLAIMVATVKEYRRNPTIRAKAEYLIANVREKDSVDEVRAIYDFVKNCIRYTSDIRDVEMLKTPDLLLQDAQGDCDDKATLVATLLESIGFKTRFIAIGMSEPNAFDHVYSEVLLGTRWVSLETTENVSMGWKPDNPVAYMVRHV